MGIRDLFAVDVDYLGVDVRGKECAGAVADQVVAGILEGTRESDYFIHSSNLGVKPKSRFRGLVSRALDFGLQGGQ